jgi:hypothetical protein
MKIISHRGNLRGPARDSENHPSQILMASNHGFDVEIDVWKLGNKYYLGHDTPQYEIEYSFFENGATKYWLHCKNLEALLCLRKDTKLNVFWHQNDNYTLTTQNYIWTYPERELTVDSIAVMPNNLNDKKLRIASGICTDEPFLLMDILNE